jgi:hypothetical protein
VRGRHGAEDQHIAHESGNSAGREIGHRHDLASDKRVGRVVHCELSAGAFAAEVGAEIDDQLDRRLPGTPSPQPQCPRGYRVPRNRRWLPWEKGTNPSWTQESFREGKSAHSASPMRARRGGANTHLTGDDPVPDRRGRAPRRGRWRPLPGCYDGICGPLKPLTEAPANSPTRVGFKQSRTQTPYTGERDERVCPPRYQ